MLLSNLETGKSAIIATNRNPQLVTKGFKEGVSITLDKKIGDDLIIDLGGNKYRITAAQAKQINLY